MNADNLALFALDVSHEFAVRVAARLNITLSAHEERDFEDGEHKSRPLISVRGKDVYVIQSLYSDSSQSVNDKLCRLLFFIGALQDASSAKITAIIPYLAYSRKDRKTKTRDPVTTRYLAQLIESVGTHRIVTLDVHNLAAFQNAFRCQTEHLEAKNLFIEYFLPRLENTDITVVSPDIGGVKRAEAFRVTLSKHLGCNIASAFIEKHRSKGMISGNNIVGDIMGRTVIIIDDMIAAGTTIARAIDICQKQGAYEIYAAATHGLFIGGAQAVVTHPALKKFLVTDTISSFRLAPEAHYNKVQILDSSDLFAEAIRRLHIHGSLVDLLAS